jgi:hypothetical protein
LETVLERKTLEKELPLFLKKENLISLGIKIKKKRAN